MFENSSAMNGHNAFIIIVFIIFHTFGPKINLVYSVEFIFNINKVEMKRFRVPGPTS